MSREKRFIPSDNPLAPPQEVEFKPATVKRIRKRQTENGVVHCAYCGNPIKHPTHEEKHHIESVEHAKKIGLNAEDIRSEDNGVITHSKDCHPHLNQMQKEGKNYPEVMRKEGRTRIMERFGPSEVLDRGEWVAIRGRHQNRSRGNHSYHARGHY